MKIECDIGGSRRLSRFIGLISFSFIVSCAHGEIDSLDYPLVDLKAMTQQFFNNTLTLTEDGGRDFKSDYFRPSLPKGRIESPRSEDKVRAKALIRFIGNERPYVIQTWVEVQTREDTVWVDQGTDSDLSKKIANELREYFKARKEKNFIDNYRAF